MVLTGLEESFIDVWTKVFDKEYSHAIPGFHECFQLTGTTLEPGWSQIVCPGDSNSTNNNNHNNNNRNIITGVDGCGSCVNKDICPTNNICGQIGMRNHGGFKAKMCVWGSVNSQQFCCSTGNYDESKNIRYIYLPCNWENVLMIGEEECAVNQWNIGGADIYPQNNITLNKCYQISGTTLNNKWEKINCN